MSAEPCRCHNSHAAVSPIHSGHCCFLPPNQDCHPQEVAAWEAERDRMDSQEGTR